MQYRRAQVTSAAVAAPAMLAGLLAGAQPAHAQVGDLASGQFGGTLAVGGEVTAYVWANQPSAEEYQPAAGYSYNSAGGVQVTRSATGSYTVVFEEAARMPGTNGGVVHATAYGPGTTALCTVGSWGSWFGDDLLVSVRCFGPDGEPVDTRFVANYTNTTFDGDGRMAYFWTDQATPEGERTLTHTYQYDSAGGPISYERVGTGEYRFDMPRDDRPVFPMVHVTAYGSTAAHCQIAWPDAWEVRCVDHDGAPVDSRFTVTYGKKVGLLGHTTSHFGSGTLYADTIDGNDISGDSYVSTVAWGADGTYVGVGQYRISFEGLATDYGHALVGPVGDAAGDDWPSGHCLVAYWHSWSADERVGVRCYDFDGNPENLHARISFTAYDGVH